jgi:hypothetical protein
MYVDKTKFGFPCPSVFVAGVQCTSSAFRHDPRSVLTVI